MVTIVLLKRQGSPDLRDASTLDKASARKRLDSVDQYSHFIQTSL
jgi:hypothetical protein